MFTRGVGVAAAGVAWAAVSHAQPVESGGAAFVGLGPAGAATSAAYGVSRDGTAIIGSVTGPGSAHRACVWGADGSFVDIGVPAGFTETYGMAVADQGAVAVLFGIGPPSDRALLWSPASGVTPLVQLPLGYTSVGRGITPDGRVVVGDIQIGDARTAIRWSAATGAVALGDLPGGLFISYGVGVSAAGDVVAGMGTDASDIGKACRWRLADPAGGAVVLTQLPGFPGAPAWAYNIARALTADGRIAVGEAMHAPGVVEACLWTTTDQIIGLGNLRPGDETYAKGVSTRALVVVGESFTPPRSLAFLWTPAHGMRDLKRVLEDGYGLDLNGWELEIAFGVSDDGQRIAGSGYYHGVREAWTATLPAPCYPDCNGDRSLTVGDIGCFQSKFVAQDPYADCNQDGAFTVADSGCFQTEFVVGCP
ncbi:MAG: hypothetical protein ACKVU4_03015 [Phycisphaerales bacterium]